MNIGTVLKDWRWASKLGVREAAKEIGLNAATFNRVERGEQMDGKTLATILCWLVTDSTRYTTKVTESQT